MDADAFLRVSSQFRLGELITESPHPRTVGLAEWAQQDLAQAIEAFHEVDCTAITTIAQALEPLADLVSAIRRTLEAGGRIYLAGCGATGRLALSLEAFSRQTWLSRGQSDRVVSFMAGGDAALIRSLEAFEDFPAYGARQLRELGFGKGDLLLAITEGGETPFVIGACLEAAGIADEPPWFLFCNPPEMLCRLAERCREVLQNTRVRPFYLPTGPMALAGSTRLQATTAQMLVAGAALSEATGHTAALHLVDAFRKLLDQHQPLALADLIIAEADTYAAGNLVLYRTHNYAITVLTDTTERSPTFSLPPFENRHRPADDKSWCYLSIPEAAEPLAAWEQLLGRAPRTLEWPELQGRGSLAHLLGHDISRSAASWRQARWNPARQPVFSVNPGGPVLEFEAHRVTLAASEAPLLLQHLLLKCALNLHSTLLMGRLGRFHSNLMTFVRPSNFKLIDRAARYAQHYHRQQTGQDLPYEEAVRKVCS